VDERKVSHHALSPHRNCVIFVLGLFWICGLDLWIVDCVGMGLDGMEMGWDEMGWDGTGWDGTGWDEMGWDGMDGMGWDGMG
jgi:hypothetical protein